MNYKENIALVGMMGCGKSTIGKRIADQLNMHFLDVDELMEYENGDIPSLFAQFGEEGFREMEAKLIKRVSTYENSVIATGGGAVIRESNRRNLKAHCYVIFLQVKPETLWRRVKRSDRPLAQQDFADFAKRYAARLPAYQEVADAVIVCDGKTRSAITKEVIQTIKKLAGV